MKHFFAATLSSLLLATTALAAEIPASLVPDDPSESALVRNNNNFALDLYKQVSPQQGNVFFSPESISTALMMTYSGAKGKTADEMGRMLHITLPADKLNQAVVMLMHKLSPDSPDYTLKIANALWVQRDYPLVSSFVTLIKTTYNGGLTNVDFMHETEAARTQINDWIAAQTADKIKDLIPSAGLTEDTKLVLTNAIYFKGLWVTPFEKTDTQNGDFHITPAQTNSVPLMHRTAEYDYFKGDGFQALRIPYKGYDLSMVIFLPDEIYGLAAFEKKLSTDMLVKSIAGLHENSHVQLTLPKFKTTQTLGLSDILQALGMKLAFNPNSADFSGISTKPLYISNVLHKAYVDVSEEGTEAAAATAVMVEGAMARMDSEPPPVFCADHPFFFIIRDEHNGSILFMGRINDPGAQ